MKIWLLPGLGESVEVGVGLRTRPDSELEVQGWGVEPEASLWLEVPLKTPTIVRTPPLHLILG